LVLSVVLSGVKDLFFESLKSPPRSFVAALLRMTKPVFFPSGDAIGQNTGVVCHPEAGFMAEESRSRFVIPNGEAGSRSIPGRGNLNL